MTPTRISTVTTALAIAMSTALAGALSHPADGAPLTAEQGARVLVCNVTADNAHYSRGARGVIGKLRYSCRGNTFGVLEMDAYLTRHRAGATGPFPPAATSLGVTRSVGPGAKGTVYVPASGRRGVRCDEGFLYSVDGRATLVGAGQTQTGAPRSESVRPRCP